MNKLKGFFVGIFLLFAVVAMVVLSSLIYRASERSTIKSYIFQTANNSNQRVGMMENLNDMSATELRNKLIKKYVAEYFKVIPGDTNITNRPTMHDLSDPNAFDYWKSNEAKTIEDMSAKKMFRLARVNDDGIATYNKTETTNNDGTVQLVYYRVKYYTSTWTESNVLASEPVYDQGTLYMEIKFEPGLAKTIQEKHYDLREYLESGKDPSVLFKFRVVNIGDKIKK